MAIMVARYASDNRPDFFKKGTKAIVSVKSEPNVGHLPWKTGQSFGMNENVNMAFSPSTTPSIPGRGASRIASMRSCMPFASGVHGCDGSQRRSSGYSGSPYQTQFLSQ